MIPKVVHFFHNHDFFQKHQSPDSVISLCMSTWRHYLQNYEIRLWHDRLPEFQEMLASSRYLRECYKRKIWAAVSDYVRAWALFRHGGIYLDTDVYLFRDFSDMLQHDFFVLAVPLPGDSKNPRRWHVEPAVLGAQAGHAVLKKTLEIYEGQELFEKPLWIANQVFSLAVLRAKNNFSSASDIHAYVKEQPISCPDILSEKLDQNEPAFDSELNSMIYPPKMMQQGAQIMRIKGRWFIMAAPAFSAPVYSFKEELGYHLCQNSWSKDLYFLETKHLKGMQKYLKIMRIWLSFGCLQRLKRQVKHVLMRIAGKIFF